MSVLDASALLALLQDEPGADRVADLLEGAAVSSVNWSEVAQRLLAVGVEPEQVLTGLVGLGCRVVDFTVADGSTAARLRAPTAARGLSLGDRACLALATRLDEPAVTADRAWAAIDVGVRIDLIRNS